MCDACHRGREGKTKTASRKLSKVTVEILHPSSARSSRPSSNLSRTGYAVHPSLERCTKFGVDCVFAEPSASISCVPTWTCLTSGRAPHRCKKNASNSTCLVLRVDPVRLITPSAAEEAQHRICCVVSLSSRHCTQTSTASSTFVAGSCFHRLQRVQRPTQLRYC